MLRTFIIDEDLAAAGHLERVLSALGASVVGIATTSEEGARQIAEVRPDLVILELNPSPYSGFASAHALRDAHDVDVAFVTTSDRFALRAFEMDAADYVVKPASSDRISTTLEKVRRRREGRDMPALAAVQAALDQASNGTDNSTL